MHQNLRSPHFGIISHTDVTNIKGDISRRLGNMRAIKVDSKIINSDQSIGMTRAIQDCSDTFSQKTPLEIQLQNDKSAYEMKVIF